MITVFFREDLYNLVWTTPLKVLAAQFGISDVGLRKICVRADSPTPERGYWAKREAGKPVVQIKLPPRPPGMFVEVHIGPHHDRWHHRPVVDWKALPSPPVCAERLESVRAQLAKAIGNATCN